MADCVFITGASSGIGGACARRFLDDGWRVAALARRAARLEALAAEYPGQVLALAGDACDAAALEGAVERLRAWTPGLQAVICAAGEFRVGAMEATSSAEFERMWRLTVWSKFYLVRELLPLLAASGPRPRAVIHIASLAAHRDFAEETAYTSAMHGVIGLARAQDAELRARGIRVAVLSPGTVRTPLTERAFDAGALAGALAPEDIANTAAVLVRTIAGGGYIPEILHLPQNST